MMDSSLRVERFTTITAGDGSATFIICLSHTRCLSTSPLNEKTLIFDLQKLLKFTLKFSDLYIIFVYVPDFGKQIGQKLKSQYA